MATLTSHEKYELYKYCLGLGVPEDVAVKIRSNTNYTLKSLLAFRALDTEVEDIIYGAFRWESSPEGFEYWNEIVDQLVKKGIK